MIPQHLSFCFDTTFILLSYLRTADTRVIKTSEQPSEFNTSPLIVTWENQAITDNKYSPLHAIPGFISLSLQIKK